MDWIRRICTRAPPRDQELRPGEECANAFSEPTTPADSDLPPTPPPSEAPPDPVTAAAAEAARVAGNDLFRAQKYPEAIAHYTECIKLNPNDAKVGSGAYTKTAPSPSGST